MVPKKSKGPNQGPRPEAGSRDNFHFFILYNINIKDRRLPEQEIFFFPFRLAARERIVGLPRKSRLYPLAAI